MELEEYCRDLGYMPEQVQDFYPTPSTLSTCMYYTGLDPRDMSPVYVPKNPHEKAMQRALIQYRDPKNRELVLEALEKSGRTDLIGFGPKCLVRPGGTHPAPGRPGNAGRQSAGQSRPGSTGRQNAEQSRPEKTGKKKKTIRNIHKKKR